MDNYILEIPNFISKKLCNEIVSRVKNDSRKNKGPALTYSITGGVEYTVDKYRKGIEMTTYKEYHDIIPIMCKNIYKIYNKYIESLELNFKDYNKDTDDNMHPYLRETTSRTMVTVDTNFAVHEIEKGRFYKWHHDQEWGKKENFVQVIIYLNTLEEKDGGCTEFINGRKVRPEIGKVLVYPKSWTFLHKGGKVLGDTKKYICTSDISLDFFYD
jgi:hypothetical protein